MTVHVIGNVALDTTFRLARFPKPGETLNADAATVAPGGKGANQALAARRAGAAALLWAAVGADAEGEALRRHLAREGLCDGGLTVLPLPTDRSAILVEASGENQIVSAVACARAYDPLQSGWRAAVRPGDVLVLQGNLRPETTRAALEAGAALGLRRILNASPLGENGGTAPGAAEILVVNRGEGEMLTGEAEPGAIAHRLLGHAAEAAVVTLGAEGLLAFARGEAAPFRIPAPPVRASDTSGAGDVFCGTLAARLSLGDGLPHALRLAGAAAAVAVTRPGTFGCGPSAAEFEILLAKDTA